MFIYLDDERIPKHTNMQVVRTYKDCIAVLKNNKVDFLSLDHDLGTKRTGYDVVKFLVEEGIEIPHINIHSANPIGRDNMKQLIERYFPNTQVSCDPKV